MANSEVYKNPRIKRLLDTKAQRLGYQGGEIGWTRVDALTVISELKNTDIGILGGDVWHIESGEARHAYANWYCNPGAGESAHDFAVRGRAKAAEYIANYRESGETFYVLVFNE
jgi:hypothetical protein